MCNVMVSHFKRNQKFQRNERQIRSERADQIIPEQADQRMSRVIRVEQIRDGSSRLEPIQPRVMIRLEQSRVKASRGKTRQIGVEREHNGEKEELFQKRIKKRSDKIRSESEKSSAEQSGANSVVQNDAERVEYPIREGIQTTAAEYMGRWTIM